MPITPTNQIKNSITPDNAEKGNFYLLTEAGEFLTQENGGYIILDGTVFIIATNQLKNAVTPTNETKS